MGFYFCSLNTHWAVLLGTFLFLSAGFTLSICPSPHPRRSAPPEWVFHSRLFHLIHLESCLDASNYLKKLSNAVFSTSMSCGAFTLAPSIGSDSHQAGNCYSSLFGDELLLPSLPLFWEMKWEVLSGTCTNGGLPPKGNTSKGARTQARKAPFAAPDPADLRTPGHRVHHVSIRGKHYN